ncbi:sterol 24-C-methyltransferase [Penicillium longicatenatum]|uniref:sterol 24-C-methyltransferase n=1 Tax=Penicillium longicatenatum TaxID=1561947 RepID=UPI002549652D|nr:sterol 24-C-methyltransferase [Penicillium longicatenatum]KAJ5644239.1 sterol 24-C-methyltransferase [Penicillium longicatenatum]
MKAKASEEAPLLKSVRSLNERSIESRGGIVALCAKNRMTHKSTVAKYFEYWDSSPEGAEAVRAIRSANYDAVAKCLTLKYFSSYYDTVTDIIEHLWASSLHLFTLKKGETMREAARRHEHSLACYAGIIRDAYVLDVGSGVGGPAREIARFTEARVLGINLNEYQIGRAIRYTERDGLSDRVNFIKADFMKMPLQSQSVDCAYSIEGTSYAPNLEGVYSEIYRVLKPGGKFAAYELIMTERFDKNNPTHCAVHLNLEKGMGIPNMVRTSDAVDALRRAGFEVEIAEDLADHYSDIPWYYPFRLSFKWMFSLSDTLRCAYITVLTRSLLVGGFAYYLAILGEWFGILPPATIQVLLNLADLNVALVEGGEKEIFTPVFLIVARKPY